MTQWRNNFSIIYKLVKTYCSISDDAIASAVSVDKNSVRQYSSNRKTIPDDVDSLCKLFEHEIEKLNRAKQISLLNDIKNQIKCNFVNTQSNRVSQQISAMIKQCSANEKSHTPYVTEIQNEIKSSGHIKAVIFDFDGTLTKVKSGTTWEDLWRILGYDVEECRELHAQYDNGDFNHSEWCNKTAKKFIEKGLTQEHLIEISKGIKLIKGCRKTLQALQQNNIKLYIVSGSIHEIIRNVLGNSYCYFSDIKANEFVFDTQTSILTNILGTEYDFEGKAKYIEQIAKKLRISTEDILFVGNSNNDTWAYSSGAKTLCVNPKDTNYHDKTIWHHTIVKCDDLSKILKYIT